MHICLFLLLFGVLGLNSDSFSTVWTVGWFLFDVWRGRASNDTSLFASFVFWCLAWHRLLLFWWIFTGYENIFSLDTGCLGRVCTYGINLIVFIYLSSLIPLRSVNSVQVFNLMLFACVMHNSLKIFKFFNNMPHSNVNATRPGTEVPYVKLQYHACTNQSITK